MKQDTLSRPVKVSVFLSEDIHKRAKQLFEKQGFRSLSAFIAALVTKRVERA